MTATPPSYLRPKMTDRATVQISTTAASSGQSDGVDLGGNALGGVLVSTAWTDAQITVQGSFDGTTYFDVYTSTGGEVTIGTSGSSAIVGRYLSFDPFPFVGLPFIKLRSGTGASPVTQVATRSLTLALFKSTPSQ